MFIKECVLYLQITALGVILDMLLLEKPKSVVFCDVNILLPNRYIS
uniref:Uncharacterized protein n=1 Tax=Anguilla anguilla TaxID=7936 RepID=A0A0E9UY62_ANGAN